MPIYRKSRVAFPLWGRPQTQTAPAVQTMPGSGRTKPFSVGLLGLLFPLVVAGCSGGGDAPASPAASPAVSAATPAATGAPAATATPSADLTPGTGISPLGGTPATEEEKEFYNKREEAKDLALARNYVAAIPLLEALHAENPEDMDVMFYLLLCYGSTEDAPKKNSKAFGVAEKIVKRSPDSREADKARSYMNSANLTIPEKFQYGDDTMIAMGSWVMTEEATYKLTSEASLHTGMQARGLSATDQAVLWETEASPATAGATDKLPKGTEVKVLAVKDYLYSLTSWRKKVESDPAKYDTTMFDVTAMYVEVISEGPLKGKKGWMVNHVDRFLGSDAWGSWISNRLKVLREADMETPTP